MDGAVSNESVNNLGGLNLLLCALAHQQELENPVSDTISSGRHSTDDKESVVPTHRDKNIHGNYF